MTTYKAIEYLIKEKILEMQAARDIIFNAYTYNKIDGVEYEKLIKLADKYLLNKEGAIL